MNKTPSPFLQRRHFVSGLAAAGLAAPWIARAQSSPARVVRIGSPDLGTAGKPSPGGGTLAIVQANRWLEEAFAKDGIEVQWHFFRGAGPAVAEALAAKQLDIVSLGDLASVIHKARGLPTRFGRWHTVYTRWSRWSKAGVLDRVFERLQHAQVVRVKIDAVSLDSTSIKVHPDGTGALKKTVRKP